MNRIFNTLKLKWPEYLLEMIVITVGILGAFFLNNWNEDRKSEITKKQLIESLISEFEYNLIALDSTTIFDQLVKININKLLDRMNSDNMDSIDYILGCSFINQTFDPVNGALNSAKTSGEIQLIENKDLLAKLFSWEGLIIDLSEEQNKLYDEQWDTMEKFAGGYRFGNAINQLIASYPKSKFDNQYSLLQNPAFEVNLLMRLLLVDSKMNEMEVVRKVNVEILSLLRNEQIK